MIERAGRLRERHFRSEPGFALGEGRVSVGAHECLGGGAVYSFGLIMKQVIFAALMTATTLSTAQAQLFSPESLGGAVVGGIAGGLIGGHGHRGEGIAIGAGAGLLMGALASSYERRYDGPYAPEYYSRPNYAVTGAVLGGVAGGVIGAGSHHTGAGIAIGAGAGLLLGSVAEQEARRRAALTPVYYPQQTYVITTAPATVLTTTPTVSQVPQNDTVAAAPASAMSSANSLFGR